MVARYARPLWPLFLWAAAWAAGPELGEPGDQAADSAAFVEVTGLADEEAMALLDQHQQTGRTAAAGRLLGAVYRAQGRRGGRLLQTLLGRADRDAVWEFLYTAGFVWETSSAGEYRSGLATDSLHTLTAEELARMHALFAAPGRGDALLPACHAALVAGATLPQPEERERFIHGHVLRDDARALEALTSLSYHLRLEPANQPTQEALVEILRRAEQPLVERFLWQIDFLSRDASAGEGYTVIHGEEVQHLPVPALDVLIERLDSWMNWVNLGDVDVVRALQRVRHEKEEAALAPAP
ncbi:MAG: hypothetical protein AB1505_02910 [Candidatus Latescibacterota bacterium]